MSNSETTTGALPKGIVFKSGSMFDMIGLRVFRYNGSEYLVYGNGPCITVHLIKKREITSSPTAESIRFYPKHTPVGEIDISDQEKSYAKIPDNLWNCT